MIIDRNKRPMPFAIFKMKLIHFLNSPDLHPVKPHEFKPDSFILFLAFANYINVDLTANYASFMPYYKHVLASTDFAKSLISSANNSETPQNGGSVNHEKHAARPQPKPQSTPTLSASSSFTR